MKISPPPLNRRQLLRGGMTLSASALSLLCGGNAFAAAVLTQTPRLTEGPYYPDQMPADTDNDLIIVNHALTPAVGEITHLTGQVLGPDGKPFTDAMIEIWQVDSKGVYINTRDSGHRQRDTNFQGYGRCPLGKDGEYSFRTIKPVPYTGRTPHIHLRVNQNGRDLLTTQIFVNGHPRNHGDSVLSGVADPVDRELLMAEFKPLKNSQLGELTANFDIVLGQTPGERPAEPRSPRGRG